MKVFCVLYYAHTDRYTACVEDCWLFGHIWASKHLKKITWKCDTESIRISMREKADVFHGKVRVVYIILYSILFKYRNVSVTGFGVGAND